MNKNSGPNKAMFSQDSEKGSKASWLLKMNLDSSMSLSELLIKQIFTQLTSSLKADHLILFVIKVNFRICFYLNPVQVMKKEFLCIKSSKEQDKVFYMTWTYWIQYRTRKKSVDITVKINMARHFQNRREKIISCKKGQIRLLF